MTPEEIEKAAENYAIDTCLKLIILDSSTESLIKESFKKGAEFANKIWQEKTRWIPVSELPSLKQA